MKKFVFYSFCLFMSFGIKQVVAQSTTSEKTEKITVMKPLDDWNISNTINRSVVKLDQTENIPNNVEEVQIQYITKPITKSGFENKRILKPGQSLIFAIENGSVKDDSAHTETLSSEIDAAIARTPKWLHYDLRFKFKMITATNIRSKMVALLNSTEKKYLDEVAFTLAFLPYEVLSSSRFLNDWDYLRKNIELIYIHADSLKYVRLIENGDTNSGDWHTTTEYRIKQGTSYIWRPVDKYYYYQFIVMPKIEQEGVYVTDNNTSITAQRTWGYGWRDYLWNNYSQAVNVADVDDRSYNNVNIAGYKVVNSSGTKDSIKIDTIQRFGEIMQMPEYLWDETPRIWLFNRSFSPTQSALDVLGNWTSRCIPMDVTSSSDYRPSQPNHIAWKHIGNCHEDALLVVAAARTALIPCMHVGDFCDDHVWAAIHDGGDDVWHHFEFFRGGCSPDRPYYWGMTNMQTNGGYGWNSSLVQGYVPDGTQINLSGTYSKTMNNLTGSYQEKVACTLDLTVTDMNNVPVDGARVQLYSTNTQYSTTYNMSAGYLWTDANGRIVAPLGTGKKYYMKIYHPKFGSYPETSGNIYQLITTNTTSDRTYSMNYKFPNTTVTDRHNISAETEKYDANKSLKISLKSSNITTGNNPIDGQNSTFYDRTNSQAGVSVYIADESQIGKFKSGDMTANAKYTFGAVSQGDYSFPIPSSGKSYVVLTNNLNYTNLVEIEYAAKIVDGADFDNVSIKEVSTSSSAIEIYPNPTQNIVNIVVEDNNYNAENLIQIFDISGRLLISQPAIIGINQIHVQQLATGIYMIKYGNAVQKFVKE